MREEVLYEILIDLHREYNALELDWCLEILIAYAVRPRSLFLLVLYWDCFTIVAQTGGYFRYPFK